MRSSALPDFFFSFHLKTSWKYDNEALCRSFNFLYISLLSYSVVCRKKILILKNGGGKFFHPMHFVDFVWWKFLTDFHAFSLIWVEILGSVQKVVRRKSEEIPRNFEHNLKFKFLIKNKAPSIDPYFYP